MVRGPRVLAYGFMSFDLHCFQLLPLPKFWKFACVYDKPLKRWYLKFYSFQLIQSDKYVINPDSADIENNSWLSLEFPDV